MNFRRCILAMAMLALFVGLASAQVNLSGAAASPNMVCGTTVASPTQVRSEGVTELLGDIVITCTGGPAPTVGNPIPTASVTVALPVNVTSRLLGTAGVTNASEALLLVDEPNTNPAAVAPGIGPAQAFAVCGTPSVGAGPGGCVQYVNAALNSATCTGTVAAGGTCPGPFGPATNTFQGVVNANTVTFFGVPVNPPASAGVGRVYRITNVRANISALGGGGLSGITPLLASVSVSNPVVLPVAIAAPTVAYVFTGLNASASGIRNTADSDTAGNNALAQCGGASSATPLRILRFTEGFGSAFKTRVAPTAAQGSGQSATPTQNVPGTISSSSGPNESGLVLGALAPTISTAGLADFGTRLKATFNNIPTGVRLFVSTANVTNAFVNPAAAPAAGNAATSYAILVASETAPEGNAGVSSNATFSGFGSATINVVELVPVSGSATAVWEVINNNPIGIDSLDFGVYWAFTANPGANTPPVGQGTVNLSFAPTFTGNAAAGAASSSLAIPRFTDTSSATNLVSISLCQTTLLFPYVVNVSGFDTGMAIANTTTDPFGTRVQNGTCDLNFYGTAAPPKVTTPNIPTATVYATLASTAAAGFNGYMIATCNFQLAHGFAFISDIGARNLAMGYLALVIQTGTGNRNSGSLGGALPNSIEILGN